MKHFATNFITAAALLALGAGTVAACPLAYSVNFSGQFGLIDIGTGAFTPIGKGLANTPDGIAGAPGGPFYTVDSVTGHLLRLETDGKVTDVGDTHSGPNMGPNGISVIGSLSDGTLYALDFSNRLYRINRKTAAMKLIGLLPTLPAQELQYDGNMTTSLNGNRDKLFFTIEIAEGPGKVGPNLYVIDPSTLAVSAFRLTLPSRVIGSGLVNGMFYLFTDEGDIVKLDTAKYEATAVSAYDSGVPAEGGPPFKGIFGVVAPVEPNTVAPPKAIGKTSKAATRSDWPSRLEAVPPRGCQ
jgi:hypothetical protein